jgi:hypothetical protein
MKRSGLQSCQARLIAMVVGVAFTFQFGAPAHAGLYAFTTHTFSPCAATGNTGPTLVQCRSAYTTAWDETDSNFTVTGGIQTWKVPISATYSIRALGAAAGPNGSNSVGFGASIQGDFTLTEGETLSILVGQRGTSVNGSYGQGGGGGTFVIKGDGTKLVIAGGGGSNGNGGGHAGVASYTRIYADASLTTAAKSGDTYNEIGGAGGTNGNAGGTSVSLYNGYPGAGLLQDAPSGGAKKFANGMLGGTDASYGNGGFGGGGAAGQYGGSGGGGYSGGGANGRHGPGGGGASFNSGVNVSETLTATAAAGSVIITLLSITRSVSTISMSVPTSVAYRATASLVASVSTPGRVTFFANNKRIPGCISIATVSSGSITATCIWRSASRGAVLLSAQLIPTDAAAFRNSDTGNLRTSVGARIGNR